MMRTSTILVVVISLVPSCVAQTRSTPIPQRQKVEEDRIAQLFETIRKEKGLKPLKLVVPSAYEARLVCSAAVTGQPLEDLTRSGKTNLDTFQIYRTQDLANRPAALTFLASDEVLRKKDFPQYSVMVFKDVKTPGMLVIGISRNESNLGHWWGCSPLNIAHWTEDGCTDHGIPKPTISPECGAER
jgi:hypothetical protein